MICGRGVICGRNLKNVFMLKPNSPDEEDLVSQILKIYCSLTDISLIHIISSSLRWLVIVVNKGK